MYYFTSGTYSGGSSDSVRAGLGFILHMVNIHGKDNIKAPHFEMCISLIFLIAFSVIFLKTFKLVSFVILISQEV